MAEALKVLLVEDNPLDAELIRSELCRADFALEMLRADSEHSFLAALGEGPDVVLSDFHLPQFDGLQALAKLRETGCEVPFILVSGSINEKVAVAALQLGAADYLMKDRLGRLGPAVRRAISQQKIERAGRLAAEALRENAAFLAEVLNSLSAAVVVLDRNGRIRATNRAWDQLMAELGGNATVGADFLLQCPTGPDESVPEIEAVREALAAVWRGEQAELIREYACRGRTGMRWFLLRANALAGATPGAVVVLELITEMKQAEQTLRRNEEHFRGLIENATDLILVVNDQGRLEFVSPAVKRMLDFNPTEVVGRAVLEFVHDEDHRIATEALQRAWAHTSAPSPVEFRVRHRDGQWRTLQSIGQTMFDAQGRIQVVINSRDVTETRRLEAQFLRTQRLEAIGTLSSGIAHDLNNILAPMLMVAPLLRGRLPDPEDAELLQMIEQAAQRGAGIIRQLLTFSRGVEGRRVPVQMRYLVKDMMTLIKETFPREIALVDRMPAALWPVVADATQIHQILLNLCVNARDAMPGGGYLTISAQNLIVSEADGARLAPLKPGRHVCLTISDTGTGIPQIHLARIFEPFFTTKAMGKGTGLGLSTVLGIVKSHGGLVTVDSEVGAGSSFRVYLPAADTEVTTTEAPPPAGLRGHGELVLIVDDEATVRRALEVRLEENGYRVLAAADGRTALGLFLTRRDEVQLVLTDVMMPGMDGVALVRALRGLAPNLPIVASSGLLNDDRQEELRALGVTQIVPKPCSAQQILTAMRELLPTDAASAARQGADQE